MPGLSEGHNVLKKVEKNVFNCDGIPILYMEKKYIECMCGEL